MIIVRDNIKELPLIDVRLAVGKQTEDKAFAPVGDGGAYDDKRTDNAGHTAWPNPLNDGNGYTLWFNYANVNPAYQKEWRQVDSLDYEITLKREPLTRLHVESHDFYNAHGQRVFIKGATDFLLYKKFLDGEDIRPLLEERSAAGANCVRVIGMVSSFSHWFPQEYGDRYYDSLPAFCALVAEYGMYVYFTIFADTQIVMPGKGQQVNHYNRVVAAFASVPNILIELVNEPYAHDNATDDPFAFAKPAGIIFFGGSYNDKLGDNLRPVPPEDAHDFHSPRDGKSNEADGGFKWASDQAVNAHPEYKYRGKPVMSGEPQKFADPNDPRRGGSTLSNPRMAAKMAGTARGTACGIFFHTASGVFSTSWNAVEAQCAAAFYGELG